MARARRARLPGRRQRLGQIDPGPALVGERDLDAGKLRRGHNVKLAYLAQDTDLGGAEARDRLTQQATGLSEAKVRSARALFSGDEVKKLLRDLSGGELAPAASPC